MMTNPSSLFNLLCGGLAAAASAQAATIELSPVADTSLFFRDGFAYSTTNHGSASILTNYQNGAGIWAMAYLRFDLSSIPADSIITGATLTLTKGTSNADVAATFNRNDSIVTGRFGVFGLLDAEGNTAQNWVETTLTASGPDGPGAELVGGANPQFDTGRTISLDGIGEFVTGGATAGVTASEPGALLLEFLQDRYEAPTDTGLATFMVDFVADGTGQGYSFHSREAESGQPVLSVTYEAVPEPATALLAALGALGLLRRRR